MHSPSGQSATLWADVQPQSGQKTRVLSVFSLPPPAPFVSPPPSPFPPYDATGGGGGQGDRDGGGHFQHHQFTTRLSVCPSLSSALVFARSVSVCLSLS